MLQHELLHVDDALATLPRGRCEDFKELTVIDEELGMLAQIRDDVRLAHMRTRGQGGKLGPWRTGGAASVLGPIHALVSPLLLRRRFAGAEDRLSRLRPVGEKGRQSLFGERMDEHL